MPYENYTMPTLKFNAVKPKGDIVMHGGFDSSYEEFFAECEYLREQGYNVYLFEGTVNQSLFSPREIYLEALKHDAVSIVLVHNHPSGSTTPSRADIAGTKRVIEAGNMIGVDLLDHIIIGDGKYLSLREEGLFK